MKINCCIAAAILAFCATAAPVDQDADKALDPIPSESISKKVQANGIMVPELPARPEESLKAFEINIEPSDLVKDPNWAETTHDWLKQNTTNHRKPNFRPFGKGGHGTVIHPSHHGDFGHLGKRKDAKLTASEAHDILKAFENDMLTASELSNFTEAIKATTDSHLNNTLSTESKLERAVLIFLSTPNAEAVACSPKERRQITHEHDHDHDVIDDCQIKTKGKSYKEANSIISHANTQINSVHSESSSDSYKIVSDAVENINGIKNLPQELREYYLDQLARFNSTSANTFNNKSTGNATLDAYTKVDQESGNSTAETTYHSMNLTSIKSHDELIIDSPKPVSLASTSLHRERQTVVAPSSSSLPNSSSTDAVESKTSSSFLTSSSTSTIPTSSSKPTLGTSWIAASPVIRQTSTLSSSSEPTTTEISFATQSSGDSTSSQSSSNSLPTTLSSVTTVESRTSVAIKSTASHSSRSRKVRPNSSTSSIEVSKETSSSMSEASHTATLSSSSAIQSLEATLSSSSTVQSSPEPSSSTPPPTTLLTRPSPTPSKTSSTNLKSLFKHPLLPLSLNTSTPANDEEIPAPVSEMVDSKGHDLGAVQPEPATDPYRYIAAVDRLSAKHVEDIEACGGEEKCIGEANRRFAGAVAGLSV